MDYKELYHELLKTNQILEARLESSESISTIQNSIAKDTVFNVFHSASHLMAISSLDSGKYVDVNNAFLDTLGYRKDEIIGHASDDIQIFKDFEESNKFIKVIPKLNKIKDYPVTLLTKQGEEKMFMFSAEPVQLAEENYLLTTFNEISVPKDRSIRESHGSVLYEIFETVSSYLSLYTLSDDNRFYILDLNRRVEEVEFISKSDVINKCIDDTPLKNRKNLLELLHHIRITGDAYKLAASPKGDDSEGYYMGFVLTSGNIVITWEPGMVQKSLDDISKQGMIFAKFAEMFPEIVFEIDTTGKVTYANQQGLNFFGYSSEDLNKGMNISELFPDIYLEMTKNLLKLTKPGITTSDEYLARRKDGSLIPIATHVFAIFHDDKIIGYRGVVTDMSKHKEYENQIIREKAFLENLYNSTPAAIATTDHSGIISMVNREFTSLFGFTSEEAAGKYINDLIVPEHLLEEAIMIDNLAAKNKKEVRQTIRKHKSGNTIYVSLVAAAITINDENVAQLGIYRDITTERKHLLLQEILFNISTAALKQYDIKDIYPTIVHELNKIWDTDNFFIALYDKQKETLSLPFFSDEKDSFHEIPTKKTITGWVIEKNKSVLLKENDLKELEDEGFIDLVGTQCKVWMGVPLKAESDIIGVMCLQDYHDENKFSTDDLYVMDFIANQIAIAIQRRIMLDNLIHARQKAEEAAQSKQLFMSTMSHEIRTPLNEVIGITNLLLQGNPRADQMDYINTLKFSGNHLLTLVNDVLDYNKMESGKIEFEKTQFNLSDFLDEIMRSYSFRSKARNLNFEIIKSQDLPVDVIGDPIRLNQILSNLLSNALKFTQQGGITVYVNELNRTITESKLEIRVKDTGIGIPADKHSSIFESFTQAAADTTRNYGGTGLGLAICKKLVELQGGSISVESESEKGSAFSVVLLFGLPGEDTPKKPLESSENYSGLEGKRILVAEDNKINFFVANKFLVGWGTKVTHAENGQIALDILEREDFDLILMDLHMPVMDGIEATRIIRNSENQKINNIPIVALTAAIMSESHDKIDDLNINDYVLKPFKPSDLFERIKKHIR